MRHTGILVAAVLALSGCGGSDGGGALNPGFSGLWVGPVVVTSGGQVAGSYTGQILIAVSGTTAVVSAVCFDGSGSLSAHGSGDSVTWSGQLACAPMAVTGCASMTQTFTSMTATLVNGLLSGQGTGTLSGCGSTAPVTFTITGTKQ